MITISLDEGGLFEYRKTNDCMFIGGAIYRCAEERQIGWELGRLEKLFKLVCAEQQCIYPRDLHPDRDGSGYIINRDEIGRVKGALSQELPDFLQGRGRWVEDKPAGSYSLYALIGDSNGIRSLNLKETGNLADEDYASNRYEHMVYRTMDSLLLHSAGKVRDTEYRLDLATRVMRTQDGLSQRETKALGYDRRQLPGGGWDDSTVQVTDATSFRAYLESVIVGSALQDAAFNLNVQSINYKIAQSQQGFLYLADTICSVYQDALQAAGAKNTAAGMKALADCNMRLLGGSNKGYLWAYDDIDLEYRAAEQEAEHHNLFEAMERIDAIRRRKDKDVLAALYDELWLGSLEQHALQTASFVDLQVALERLDAYLRTKDSLLSTARYIHKRLKEFVRRQEKAYDYPRLMFNLYKTEMTICNHSGDFEEALKALEACVAVAPDNPIEEYLGLQNTYAVTLLDSGNFEKAYEVTNSALGYHEMLVDIRKELYPGLPDVFVSYGRTLSQAGQNAAFTGEYAEALELFSKAIENFGDNAVEIARTRSYLLHAYIEMGDKDAYEAEAVKYFGSADLKKQMEAILKLQQDAKPAFAWYVFSKAVWTFYRGSLNKKDTEALVNRLRREYAASTADHPWEMILKYAAFLWYAKCGTAENADADEMMAASRSAVEPKGILEKIVENNDREYAALKAGDDPMAEDTMNYMYR